MSVADFWEPFEVQIGSFDELVKALNEVMEKATVKNIQFAWRGLVDYRWALHSSLYRRLCLTRSGTLPEPDLAGEERSILDKLYRWGLHSPPVTGRLSILNQLAMLQHYGAPTRLVDISFNAWVGVRFAVEEKWSNGEQVLEDIDCRLFAVDVTGRLINDDGTFRSWEDHLTRPWLEDPPFGVLPQDWTSSVHAWKPSSLDSRIFAQNGGFLFGGVPATITSITSKRFQFPKTPNYRDGWWTIEEGRKACCLALRPHVFSPSGGGLDTGALYTFRIAARAKKDIRDRLEKMFGYTHATIYPDYTGFAQFGTPNLKTT